MFVKIVYEAFLTTLAVYSRVNNFCLYDLVSYIAAVYQCDWYSNFAVERFGVPELLALRYAENIEF